MKNLLVITILIISIVGCTQSKDPLVDFVSPSYVSAPRSYSHSAIVNLGNCKMVIISGQVPIDSQGKLVGIGDFEKQAEQVYQNIKNAVTEAGGTMDNIVKTNIYLTDMSHYKTFREIRKKYINPETPPAATLVEVSSLAGKDIMIEIEATAIIPNR